MPTSPSSIETDCPACEGEGGHNSQGCGTTACTCDGFSGGCVKLTPCELCEGRCEVGLEEAYEWALEQLAAA